ncbi:protein of unknown function [Candidatus Nitrosotalea okcheonensis]|uniref:Uncharacterized protein n=1 Tax=Candidatus Nitrosotalea okcheonensis TaxID=1903276 RepID=A0A2H1FI00_9ARCH|nr:protein of unknown function [Candidatus Nitrosotalea okcheonensis]
MNLGEKKINSETIDNVKNREKKMDADNARYFLFEKTSSSACLCNPTR